MLNRLPSLGTQSAHALIGVVARKSSQVHAGNRAQQPCRLPFFLHGAPGNVCLRPPLDGAGVHANLFHPIDIQRNAAVREKGTTRQGGDGRFQFGRELARGRIITTVRYSVPRAAI